MAFLKEFSDFQLVDISEVPADWVTKSFVITNVYREINGQAAMKVVEI